MDSSGFRLVSTAKCFTYTCCFQSWGLRCSHSTNTFSFSDSSFARFFLHPLPRLRQTYPTPMYLKQLVTLQQSQEKTGQFATFLILLLGFATLTPKTNRFFLALSKLPTVTAGRGCSPARNWPHYRTAIAKNNRAVYYFCTSGAWLRHYHPYQQSVLSRVFDTPNGPRGGRRLAPRPGVELLVSIYLCI